MNIFKNVLLNGICAGHILWAHEPYTLIDDLTDTPIVTPCFDKRETLKMRLSNGLEVYLISDPKTPQAGAVLTVGAGSWNDPEEYPGIAHFLEHMLFLGTEQYPIESDYNRFIREHDGRANAYTASDHTLYLFSIAPSALDEALDRFSSFFKNPLFNPSGVDRELNAINQEFAKNLDQDNYRQYYVSKELANPNHPFKRFNAGNSATLSKVSQNTLKEWYRSHYSANHMKLIVCGPQSVEHLKKTVVSLFKDIPNSGSPLPPPSEEALGTSSLGKLVCIEPVKDNKTLQITWEMPARFAALTSYNPSSFIASLLGHEGEGSLLADLKSQKLAESLSCGGYKLGEKHPLFTISIKLTEEGLKQYSQVIERCFQTIHMIKQQEIPDYLFKEIKQTLTARYQYQSREDVFDYLMGLGELLAYEDLSSFPEQALVPKTLDLQIVSDFLNNLTPQKVYLTLIAKQPDLEFDTEEQWMKVRYKMIPIADEEMEKWSKPASNPKLFLPAPNPFIPEKLCLMNSSEIAPSDNIENIPTPSLLIDDNRSKVYFAQDNRFHLPKAQWFFTIKTPSVDASDPVKMVLARLYVKCIDESLNRYVYPAQMADLSYDLSLSFNGISLTLFGYHENAETLFDLIAGHLKNCQPSESNFEIYKDSLLKHYTNFSQESALQQGLENYRHIICESHSTSHQCLNALNEIDYKIFLSYLDHLYDQTYIEGLFYGNVSESQAVKVSQKLQNTLASGIYPEENRLVEKLIQFSETTGPYMVDVNIESPSHAALLGIEGPSFSFKARAAQQILGQAISNAFFSSLRTQQQTGYLVFSKAEELHKHLYTFFAVQSASHDPRDLLARFELFIEDFLQGLGEKNVTSESFESIRNSLMHSLQHTPQNLAETGPLLKLLAFNYDGDFNWMKKRMQAFQELTYVEFLEIAAQFLGKQNKKRLAVIVHGTPENDFHYITLPSPRDLRTISKYIKADENYDTP